MFDKITALMPNVLQLTENEKLQFLLEEEHDAASATSFVTVCHSLRVIAELILLLKSLTHKASPLLLRLMSSILTLESSSKCFDGISIYVCVWRGGE